MRWNTFLLCAVTKAVTLFPFPKFKPNNFSNYTAMSGLARTYKTTKRKSRLKPGNKPNSNRRRELANRRRKKIQAKLN